MQPASSLVPTYRRHVAPSQHCAAIFLLVNGARVAVESTTHSPEPSVWLPSSTQTPPSGKTIGERGGGSGGESGGGGGGGGGGEGEGGGGEGEGGGGGDGDGGRDGDGGGDGDGIGWEYVMTLETRARHAAVGAFVSSHVWKVESG